MTRLHALLLTVFVAAAAAFGQFGQNKVQYESFHWRYISSEHFDVYFPEGNDRIAEFTAETAENSLKLIEHSFNYQLEGRVTIVTYQSHNAFEQTNVSGEIPEESVGGFTEFLKNRMVFPFTGNYEDFRHVIHHELTHAVNMRMFYGTGFQSILMGAITSDIPLWFTEGLAEYESRFGWDIEADMFLRDATITGYLPPMNGLGGYMAYKGGQSVFYYVDRKYGWQKVSEFIREVKKSRSVERAVKATLSLDMKDFNREWQNWLKQTYWPQVADLRAPADFSERLTNHEDWGNFVNTGAGISPDGTQIAFVSDRTDYFDVWSLDIESGKLKRLLSGARSPGFEELKWLDTRVSWSPDGKLVTFASKSGARDAINILDVRKRKIKRRLRLDFDGIFNPTFSPDGTKIAFSGMRQGESDVYYYDLVTGKVVQVTADIFSDDDPVWSPDGKRIVFSSDRGDSLRVSGYPATMNMWKEDYHLSHLYGVTLGSDVATKITSSPYNERTATFTSDGKFLIYVSDANGIDNLYRLNLATDSAEAITNCLTGCLRPSCSMQTQRLVFTSLSKGGYDIFMIKNPQDLAAQKLKPTNFRATGTPELPQADTTHTQGDSARVSESRYGGNYQHYVFGQSMPAETTAVRVDTATTRSSGGGFYSKKYKTKFTPDFFFANAGYSSFFGAQGSGQLLFSDVLGNHMIGVTTDLYYDFQNLKNTNFSVIYLYLPHRINYAAGIFRNVYYLNSGNWQDQVNVMQLAAAYPFSRFTRAELNLNGFIIDRGLWTDAAQDWLGFEHKRVLLPELAYVHDTALWGYTGPVNGSRYRVSISYSPPLGKNTPDNQRYADFYVAMADFRNYLRVARDFSLASRVTAGLTGGPDAPNFYVGGTDNWINRRYLNDRIPSGINNFYFSDIITPFRGADFFEARGTGKRFFLTNQEFRFPLIQTLQMRFPLQIGLYDIRGAMFTDIGAAWNDNEFKLTKVDSAGKRRLFDPRVAFGFGVRANLGIFVLSWDTGWLTDFVNTGKPRYYVSIGPEF
ncbi:MAG TPA: hypothetical protein VGL38_14920 [bacterium]|jgi:Tol biopolymer transport system component